MDASAARGGQWLRERERRGDWHRLLIDLDPDGNVAVSSQHSDELPRPAGQRFKLAWPLGGEQLEALRWYLEDYLRVPFGVYGDLGREIEQALTEWGERVFAAVFGPPAAHDAYLAAQSGPAPLEIVIRSDSPGLLGLPWELMADPARTVPLALDRVRLSRSLHGKPEPYMTAGGGVLRVLMVISRPRGAEDVGYRMVARPLLRRLEAVRGKVELVVLRPPTLEALNGELRAARAGGEPFQIVHFDGHGVLRGAATRRLDQHESRFPHDQGTLIFERTGGGSDPVPAAELADVLNSNEVPLAVLNACQSGAVGKELEAAVATRVLQAGVGSVVAMAYSIYAVAAAEFMAAFYESLFSGEPVDDAVAAGRRRLADRPNRPSAKGETEMADWLVPVHYKRRDIYFPDLRTDRSAPVVSATLDTIDDESCEEEPGGLDPVGSFVGRDRLFYELEVALTRQRVVVLHGSAGIGKTELAKAFGRWWRDTGGVENPDWVVFVSFESGTASVDDVVSVVGRQACGPGFAIAASAERRAAVLELLRRHRVLLIWDNFETVYTMNDGSTVAPHPDRPHEELREFVAALGPGARSRLIITSRTTEDWLGELHRIPVDGLTAIEAIEYGDVLLGQAVTPELRATGAFAELLEVLGGHPLCMRLVVPHLASTDAETLLSAWRGTAELPPANGNGAPAASLDDCVNYAFERLTPKAREALVVLCLFRGVIDSKFLEAFARVPELPERFRSANADSWLEMLEEAAKLGLVVRHVAGERWYHLHPALPHYCAKRWRLEDADEYRHSRAEAELALLRSYAEFCRWAVTQIKVTYPEDLLTVIELNQRTLEQLLQVALEAERWDHATWITPALHEYLHSRGHWDEARRLLDLVGAELEEARWEGPQSGPADALWLYILGRRAKHHLENHELGLAERAYLDFVDALGASASVYPEPVVKQDVAAAYSELGRVARQGGRFEEAEEWHRRSLAINESIGIRPAIALNHLHLGESAMDRGRLDDAEAGSKKALEIFETVGERTGVLHAYLQLGKVAERRGRFDEAEAWIAKAIPLVSADAPVQNATIRERLGDLAHKRGRNDEAERWYTESLGIAETVADPALCKNLSDNLGGLARDRGALYAAWRWFEKSLGIAQALGDQPGIAVSYERLASMATESGHLDEAQMYCEKALAIRRPLANPTHLSASYHQLGNIAYERGRLEEAVEWYSQALAITEAVGDPRRCATYGQMAMVAEAQGQDGQALEWLIRCVSVFETFPHAETGPAPLHLAEVSARLGIDTLEECWRSVTAAELPQAVRDFVASFQPRGDV